uniref:DNA excision repair protein ERCC-6-like 2 isoform X2 n=1 Tax=Petromyzon marinus TaxID=7757 RepID=A0AAJ7X6J8_PETMA|nr:DNA excision repair protein ERCC-6-like 2 isoform X2 [Petromyzon marinus]
MSLLAGRRSVPTSEEKTGEARAGDGTGRGGNKEAGFGSDDGERIGVDEEKGEGRREEPRQGERRRGGPCGEDDGGRGRDCERLGERFLCRHFARGEGCVMGDAGPESEDQVVMFLAGVLGRIGHGPHQLLQTELREIAFTSTNSQDVKPALVLCSPPRLLAWAEALERRGTGCRAVVVDGAESAGALAGLLHGDRHHEVAVATYATARLHLHEMNSVQWSMVIVEEPQRPRDQDGEAEPWPPKGQGQHCDSGPLAPHEGPWPAQSGHHAVPPCPVGDSATSNFHNPWIRDWHTLRAIRCPVRIGLADTALRSSLVDLWSIVDWAVPGSLGSIGEFHEEFASPIETARWHSATGRERRRAQVATRALARRLFPHLFLPYCRRWTSAEATTTTRHHSNQDEARDGDAGETVACGRAISGEQWTRRAPVAAALAAVGDPCRDSTSSDKGVTHSIVTAQVQPSDRLQQPSLLGSGRFTCFLEEFAEFFEMGGEIAESASSDNSCSDSEKETGARQGDADEPRGEAWPQRLSRRVDGICVISASELTENVVPESPVSRVAETESSHEGGSSSLEQQSKDRDIISAVPDTGNTSSNSERDRASPVKESCAFQRNPAHNAAALKQSIDRPRCQRKTSEGSSSKLKIARHRQRSSVAGEVSEESDDISISSSDELVMPAAVRRTGGVSVQAEALVAPRQAKRIVFEGETPEIKAFSLSSDEGGVTTGVRADVRSDNPLGTDTTPDDVRRRTEPLLPHSYRRPQQEAVAAAGGAPIPGSESRTLKWKGVPVTIGQTPDTMRREHFEEMARHRGLGSVQDLATLILHSDREGRLKIMQDFYTSRQPELCGVLTELYATGVDPRGEKPPRAKPPRARKPRHGAPLTYDSSSGSDDVQEASCQTRHRVAVAQGFEDEVQGTREAYTCVLGDNKPKFVPSSVTTKDAPEQERGLICSSADLTGSKQQLCNSRVFCSSGRQGLTSLASDATVGTGTAARSSTDDLSELLGDTSILADFFGHRRDKGDGRGGGCGRSRERPGGGEGKRASTAALEPGPIVKVRAKRRDFLDEILSGDGGAESVEQLMDPSRVEAMTRPGLLHRNKATAGGREECYDPWDTALWKKNESFFLKRGDS